MPPVKFKWSLIEEICQLRSQGNNVKGIAEIVGIHRKTIYDWLKKGEKARRGKYAQFYSDWLDASEQYKLVKPNKGTYNPKYYQKRLSYSHKGYGKFRRDVLERDGYACVCCGYDDELEVHHLEGATENPDLMAVVDNGVTLCKYCHSKFHHIYTRQGFNSNDFSEFMDKFQVIKEF